jgi:hypothetical protein
MGDEKVDERSAMTMTAPTRKNLSRFFGRTEKMGRSSNSRIKLDT